ncbi:MAG: ATP-binding protein [Bacteriovorax sp.]|nr:ATP-binding protein [Bacteriovorax sp.]
MWIQRDISSFVQQNTDPIQIIRGPRQCGKSSLLLHLDPEFKELSLDDPALRELAQNDPELFLRQFNSQKLFIDEAQYAPALFPSLKRMADLYKRDPKNKPQTILRLTGSNQILMDRNVKESLAGRASFFDMNTLSVAEILSAKKSSIQDILYMGGWPELHASDNRDPKKFLDDYINTYVEKDIVLAAGIQKSREFLKFVRLLAGRVGGLLDFSSLGKDAGVDAKTIKDWISILERMHIIALVVPYSSNLSSRLTKSPKIYFIDTGLACRLQGWTSAGPIITSPQQGPLFENLVFSEIFKLNINYQLGWQVFHWRSRDGEEIDFLIQKDPKTFLFIEAKVSDVHVNSPMDYPEVKKIFQKKIPPLIVCHQEGDHILRNRVPIAQLKEFLLKEK